MAEPISLACLLVHGINGTPYDMEDLAVDLNAIGVHAETLLLPGHDVRPWVAQRFGWDEWAASVLEAFESLKARYKDVILIGHSMGGALSLHLTAHDPRVAGIATLCAPAELHAGLLPLARHGHRWLPYVPKFFEDIRDNAERWHYLRRRSLWFVPTKPMYSLLQALPQLRDELDRITCPALIMAARNDHVVPARDGRYIYEHIGSQEKSFVMLQHSWHVVTRDIERDIVTAEVLSFVHTIALRLAAGSTEKSLTP